MTIYLFIVLSDPHVFPNRPLVFLLFSDRFPHHLSRTSSDTSDIVRTTEKNSHKSHEVPHETLHFLAS